MPTRTYHRDQLLHTNVTCRNRNSMQTNIIQLGKRQREKEGKKKDGRFRSLHSSVIVFVSFPVSISHCDWIHIREQSTDHGVSGRPRKWCKLKVRHRRNEWTLQQEGNAVDIVSAPALTDAVAFAKKWRKLNYSNFHRVMLWPSPKSDENKITQTFIVRCCRLRQKVTKKHLPKLSSFQRIIVKNGHFGA